MTTHKVPSHKRKLTDEQVAIVRHLRSLNMPVAEMSQEFKVCEHSIRCLLRGRTYKNVKEVPVPDSWLRLSPRPKIRLPRRPRLTPEKIQEIRALLSQGMMGKEVGERFGVSQAVISSIKTGKSYSKVRDDAVTMNPSERQYTELMETA